MRSPLLQRSQSDLVLQFLAFAALALTLVAQPVRAAGDRLLFWESKTPGATVYLLGSMHLATPDLYPLRGTIMQAFEASDKLVVELDIGGGKQMAITQRMLERGAYPPGKTLRDDLTPSTYDALSRRLQANGMPAELMLGMKPGLVITTLSTIEMMKLGLNPEQGVDRFFLERARGSKPIVELETVDRQLDVLLDTTQPELLVKQTLGQLEELERLLAEMITSWKRGDAAALQKLVIDDELRAHPEFRDLHRRMFDDRNREMADKILAMQERGGVYFVVVGAGHLLGDQGIVELLKDRGQAPRQL